MNLRLLTRTWGLCKTNFCCCFQAMASSLTWAAFPGGTASSFSVKATASSSWMVRRNFAASRRRTSASPSYAAISANTSRKEAVNRDMGQRVPAAHDNGRDQKRYVTACGTPDTRRLFLFVLQVRNLLRRKGRTLLHGHGRNVYFETSGRCSFSVLDETEGIGRCSPRPLRRKVAERLLREARAFIGRVDVVFWSVTAPQGVAVIDGIFSC